MQKNKHITTVSEIPSEMTDEILDTSSNSGNSHCDVQPKHWTCWFGTGMFESHLPAAIFEPHGLAALVFCHILCFAGVHVGCVTPSLF